MFTALSTIAKVSLGFKSLQNNFFYLNKATIDTFNIESVYLTPILMMRDLDGKAYRQKVEPSLWLFNCRASKADLRGTGALRYIEAMADRPAAEKKQTDTSKGLTIRAALEAQGGGTWYAPKARPNEHHVWLRKAFDGVFSPFVFETAALVDQRCNSLAPEAGYEWEEVAAVLTSSLFAYSLEINGSASLGAGALEAPTTKLRGYPVLDLSKLKAAERKQLVTLAKTVWKKEQPIDWSKSPDVAPGKCLQDLDEWIIGIAGKSISLNRLYTDIAEVCHSRITVATDKIKKTKKKHSDSIGNVADAIVKSITPRLQLKNFPDDFVPLKSLDVPFSFDRRILRKIEVHQLLGSYDVKIIGNNGITIHEATYPRATAEAIIRSLLLGRSAFSVSSNDKLMDQAVNEFIKWIHQIERSVTKAIAESALGTGYEDSLKREIFARLNIHPQVGDAVLPKEITFSIG